MTDQKEMPDFIVDKFGNVRDVRHLKDPHLQHLEAVHSSPAEGGRSKSQTQPQGSYVTIIPIGLMIMIIALVCRSAVASQNRNKAEPYHESATFFNMGNYHFDEGDYEKAIAEFNVAISMEPEFGEAYNNRGLVYFAEGNYAIALLDFEKAVQLLPDTAMVYNNRGITYFAKDDAGKAIADFSKAIELSPEFAKAYHNRGLVYNSMGSYDMAISDFDMAILFTPENILTSLNAVPTEARGLINNLKEIQSYADLPLAYFNRGLAYLGIGESELARADFEKALELGLDTTTEEQVKQFLEDLQ